MNVRLLVADVAALPFPDGSFDLATCRIAIHHFPDPLPILVAMRRVLRPAGRAVVCDTLASEDAAQAALHNRIEQIRDPFPRADAARVGATGPTAGGWIQRRSGPPHQQDAAGSQARLEEGELRFTHRSGIYALGHGA